MSVDTHTASLLYHYLRMLSVRVDRGTVARLLAHPLGNSMRGLSDALDGLGIRNAAYQLPPEYFGRLEAPLAGGRVICQVYYNDGLGGSFVQAYETNDRQAMEEALQAQHPDGKADCWYPA